MAFAVCEKLSPQWSNLMGRIGYRTLLTRALTQAGAEVPWLSAVEVNADGSLAWSDILKAQEDPEKVAAGSVRLIVDLLGLLEAFIGETLAMRLMRDVWPKVPLNDLDSDKGEQNEKAK